MSDEVMNVLERPTEQCEDLRTLVKKGVAFHHAGLMNRQRGIIEEAFRAGIIKAICSTTTLGFGVNMPAHTVLVRDTSRYENGYSERLGINEVTQLFGRAGRPKYDKEGRALLLAIDKGAHRGTVQEYIMAETRACGIRAGMAPVMRTHILAFVAAELPEQQEGDAEIPCEELLQLPVPEPEPHKQHDRRGHVGSIRSGSS